MEELWLVAVATVSMLFAAQGRAAQPDYTDLEAVRALAERAVLQPPAASGTRRQATAATLDPRLRLQACATPPTTAIAGDGQLRDTTTVAVRCAGPTAWTVFVRVAVRTEVPALTALRLLPRGAALVAADFEQRPRVVNGLGEHYALDLAALIGARLRRPLNAGEALDSDNLDRPPLIRRGQQVTLIARNPALEIRVAAVAMSDGQAEQRISVQNLNTRQIVEAVVRSGDLVEVPL